MKKICISFLFILVILISSLPVSAAEITQNNTTGSATISVTVPETHKVEIKAPEGVVVKFNGKTGDTLDITRLEDVVLDITVPDGYKVQKIMLGNQDVTAHYSNGKLSLSGINADNLELKVETVKVESAPTTGDSANLPLLFTVTGTSLLLISVTLIAYRRKEQSEG